MSPLTRFPRSRASARRLRRTASAALLCAAITTGAASGPGGPDPGPDESPSGPRQDTVPTALHSARAAAQVMDHIPEKGRPADGPGENILLVGLDRRSGMTEEEKDRLHVNGNECNCTDTMMLVHLSRDRERVSTISIPRDSYVRYAPHHDPGVSGLHSHEGKINGAYQHGGPALTVRTVEKVTSVRIDHYAETDFTGFPSAVDSSGGARICTGKDLYDENAGLDLKAGDHTVDGGTALRYVRARHVSPPGDLGRVRRQQRLVERMLSGIAAAGRTEQLRLALAWKAVVRTDDGLTAEHLAQLGRDLHGLEPRQTEFATVPMSEFDFRSPEWGSALLWDRPRAEALFEGVREDRPLTQDRRTQPPGGLAPVATPPESITVRVEGEGAAEVRRALRENGFRVQRGTGTAGGTGTTGDPGPFRAAAPPARKGDGTVIVYRAVHEKYARALATALPQAVLRRVEEHAGPPVVRVGHGGTEVVRVVYDRSSVEGAPVTGDAFGCGGR